MRSLGGILVLLGVLGFFYASSRIADLEPPPEGLSLSESIEEPAGRWTLVRYGCATVAGLGLLVAVFARER